MKCSYKSKSKYVSTAACN